MDLEIRTMLLLKNSYVRVLVFDEVHNLLAGNPREQRVILQLLRYLEIMLVAERDEGLFKGPSGEGRIKPRRMLKMSR